MAGESMTAKATLKADTRPFVRSVTQARGAFTSLEQGVTKATSAMSLAMAAVSGFGIAQVVATASRAWSALSQKLEADARKISAAAGGGAGAQDLRAQAVQARARRLSGPFRATGSELAAAGLGLLGGTARAVGAKEVGDLFFEQGLELVDNAKAAANATKDLEENLSRAAAAAEEFDRKQFAQARKAIEDAEAVGSRTLDEAAAKLEAAYRAGVVDAVKEQIRVVERQTNAIRRADIEWEGLGR